MMSALSKFILKIVGWKITGRVPHNLKKNMLIVIPHTSNWDFPLGLLARSAAKIKVKFVAKHTLFKPGIGWFFKALGGIPVDRSKRGNTVQAMADLYDNRDELSIVIAPEGTRKKVDKLKRGFYFIAKTAKVPIIPIKFDFRVKEVHFGDPFYPTDDERADLDFFEHYFDGVEGKVSENSYGYGR
jgi:1-acyl-sn-glycerol-3-phosphate acyltransferase